MCCKVRECWKQCWAVSEGHSLTLSVMAAHRRERKKEKEREISKCMRGLHEPTAGQPLHPLSFSGPLPPAHMSISQFLPVDPANKVGPFRASVFSSSAWIQRGLMHVPSVLLLPTTSPAPLFLWGQSLAVWCRLTSYCGGPDSMLELEACALCLVCFSFLRHASLLDFIQLRLIYFKTASLMSCGLTWVLSYLALVCS